MLVLRLQRTGKRNQPYFRIVAADKRRHVKAKTIQVLGNFNPRSKELNFESEKIKKLLDQGAQISNRLSRLLKNKIKHVRIKVSDRPARKPKAELKKEPDKKTAQPDKRDLAPQEPLESTQDKEQKVRVEPASK